MKTKALVILGLNKPKKKLPLLAKIFGKKYYIRIVEDIKEDEIVFRGHKIYIPANSILFNKGERNETSNISFQVYEDNSKTR